MVFEIRESRIRLDRMCRQFDVLTELRSGVEEQLDHLSVQIFLERKHLEEMGAEMSIGGIVPVKMEIE